VQVVTPIPEAQRLLPSLKLEQERPASQSSSLEHLSHSSPVLRQPLTGTASSARSNNRYRDRLIQRPRGLHRILAQRRRRFTKKAFGLTVLETAC
jgi:hypothetical protein